MEFLHPVGMMTEVHGISLNKDINLVDTVKMLMERYFSIMGNMLLVGMMTDQIGISSKMEKNLLEKQEMNQD